MKKKVLSIGMAMAMVILSGCSGSKKTESVAGNNSMVNTDKSDVSVAPAVSSVSEETKPESVGGGTSVGGSESAEAPVVSLGVSDKVNNTYNLPEEYNSLLPNNIDEGVEFSVEFIGTMKHPSYNGDKVNASRLLKFSKKEYIPNLEAYWEETDFKPLYFKLTKDTSFAEIANLTPSEYKLMVSESAKIDTNTDPEKYKLEKDYFKDQFKYFTLPYIFEGQKSDERNNTLQLELVDSAGHIVEDPATVSFDDSSIKVKAIMQSDYLFPDHPIDFVVNLKVPTLDGGETYKFYLGQQDFDESMKEIQKLFGAEEIEREIGGGNENRVWWLKNSQYTMIIVSKSSACVSLFLVLN